MALRGNLKDFSLPDVFQLVTFSRKTGVLRIEREDGALGSVWFRDGDVFFAQSNWHTEPLGERLVRAQRLTPQALDRALKLRSGEGESGKRLGQILIDEGYITDKVLESFVSEQIQETIFDLMRWDEGDFDFEAMPEAVEEDIGLSVSIENVIMEGSRRLEEWTRIKKKIPSVDVVFKMATAPGEGTFEISLKPMEWNLLLLVDGTRSVAELAHETDRTDFEVARIIYGLFSAGLLEFATDEEVERLRAERAVREQKLAVIEKKRKAAEKAAAAEAQAREAALEAEAEARRGDAATASAAEPVQAPVASTEPVEVPEFLGGMSAAPTADDAAVLQEMMGAVLQVPTAAEAPAEPTSPEPEPSPEAAPEPVAPHVPAEDPAFMAVDHVDVGDLPMMPVPSVDELLTDLADLQTPNAAAADEAASAVAAAWEDTSLAGISADLSEPETDSLMADLGESLLSLGDDVEPVVEAAPVSDEAPIFDFGPEAQPEVTSVLTEAAEPDTEHPDAEHLDTEHPDAEQPEAELIPVVAEADFVFEPVSEPASLTPPQIVEDVPVAEEPVFVPVQGVSALEPGAEQTPQPVEFDLEPVAEPASEQLVEVAEMLAGIDIPHVEVAPEPEAVVDETPAPAAVPEPADDFERDLMSLGLGELPADLFGDSTSPADADVAVEEPAYEWVETPMPVAPVSAPVADATQGDAPDFSELLESLDVEPEPVAIEPEVTEIPIVVAADEDFDEELLREVAPAETGGVISTDAFLDDISMDDMDFSGGLTDELSALTGADRPNRPTTNVNKIPDANSEMLRRDARVDKDTLLKIIDGIKNL